MVEAQISSSLEDYLETIYLLVQDHGFARVKDIARARGVKAATVSTALRRLADSELVRYERREYIGLTPRGEEAARRILTRHRLLTRFFESVLHMEPKAAGDQACAMEHSLTDEAMDRLVRFFEFLGSCPQFAECHDAWLASRQGSASGAVAPGQAPPEPGPPFQCPRCTTRAPDTSQSVAELKVGQRGIVTRITATGALRQRLLDMGILPETPIDLERAGLGGDPLWIRCQGARLALRRAEAGTIRVRAEG